MLQDIRANAQGTVSKIIVGVIVAAFALFGVESILLSGGSGGVAEVNGEEISPQELQQAMTNQKRRLIAMMGDNLDPSLLDDQLIQGQVMEGLVQRKLMVQGAKGMGLTISDRQLGAIIGEMEQFQVGGQFSPELYRGTLSDAGYTPASFKATLGDDLIVGQARSGLAGSEFSTPAELSLSARLVGEQRDIRFLTIPIEGFAAQTEVSEEDIAAYYEANASSFLSEETVDIDYIALRAEDFREPVDESMLQNAYQEELQASQYQTESAVSHILFELRDEESADEWAARVAEAQAKLDAGADFAELASTASDDIGSKGFGGELGYTAGEVFPAEMEQAIAALEVGQVSQPVQTEAGIHLIKVTDRREGTPPTFEELRADLEEREGMAQARVELMSTVEALKDLAFNAEDLSGPASEMSLELSQEKGVSRSQQEGLFSNAMLISAAFSDDVLSAGYNSEVIELSPDLWVVLRVNTYNEAAVLPLEAVRDSIVASLTDQRSREAVGEAAQGVVASLRAGASVEALANEQGYEWQVELGADRRNLVVPGEVLQSAFALAAPAEGESSVDYVISATGDALVFELDRVTSGDLQAMAEGEQAALRQQMSGEAGQLLDSEIQQRQRDSAEISVI
ncbi:peptidylprolyl isomerase [Halioglobus maricola]|uniref:Periplasmic chaperone PpiD n=1 Tax=Halioglobus maricola TaxID=2601894 RepID=A0A5P9NJF1_9GAMM|nr:SurA N-terminal domain-containing protein [Halioglobus maricola]QFU75887.1 peptidylprolyl isomerase [Halioglobus maricola]